MEYEPIVPAGPAHYVLMQDVHVIFLASGSSVSDTSENAKSSTNALYFRQDQDRHNTVGNCDPIVSTERGFRRVSELFETRRGFVGSIVREGFALVMSS